MQISNLATSMKVEHSVDSANTMNRYSNQELRTKVQESVEDKSIDIKEIEDIARKMNKQMQVYDRRLDISIHEKTKKVMVKVVDTNTDEVIRELPPEKMLDLRATLMELSGLMLDSKV